MPLVFLSLQAAVRHWQISSAGSRLMECVKKYLIVKKAVNMAKMISHKWY